MVNEILKVKGVFSYELYDMSGFLKEHKSYNNLVVNVGRNFIVNRLISNEPLRMSHLALGSFQITNGMEVMPLQTLGDTQLFNEQVRVANLNGFGEVPSGLNIVIYKARFDINTPPFTLFAREAGIFNSPNPNQGTMLCRTTFPTISKLPTDILNVTWTITIEGTE